MKIELPCYGIVLTADEGGLCITSDLHEPYEYPEDPCSADREEEELALCYNAAMDGIEALILAHAVAGIDIESPAYLEGIETAVDACASNY